MSKIKVGLSALHYPVTMARYFWDALDRRDDVEVYAVGPFFGSWIPWNHGMELPQRYVKVPFLCLPKESANYHMHYEMVDGQMPQDLDLFLTIDAGWHFSTKPKANINVLIKTDPHAISSKHYSVPKGYSDLTFCMQGPYMEPGDFYLPYAYDPTVHYPMDLPKEHDACLIGLQYEHRIKLCGALKKAGISVFSGIGVVYDEYREVYNRSRVALSWSSMQDTPTRVYEAFGMALPLVANRTPDLCSQFVENDHFLGFDTVGEAVEKVRWALDHYDDAVDMAWRAHRKAEASCQWDHRIEQVLRAVKLIL